MSNQFVEEISRTLRIWDENSLDNDVYYDYLSWSGAMLSTEAFESLPSTFQTNTRNANIAEGNAGSGNASTSTALSYNNCN